MTACLLGAPFPAEAQSKAAAASSSEILLQVLVALSAVIAAGEILGRLFRALHQPPVIGQVFAGILLGPSLWGETISHRILPAEAAPYLGLIAQLGIVLYMFLVGLEVNAGLVRRRARATAAISFASIAVPFVVGMLVSRLLYPRYSSAGTPFLSFSLAMGVAFSITAFPVLARILADRGITRTELGTLAIGSAAVQDVAAWCLLAIVLGFARSDLAEGLIVSGCAVLYMAFLYLAGRPLARGAVTRWRQTPLPSAVISGALVAVLLSSLITEAIGIHALFGAFLVGVLIPRDSAIARHCTQQLETVVASLLLPAFFAYTGMRTRIDLISGAEQWLLFALILFAATAAKFGGTFAAARWSGMGWRSAAALGALMNTRGLMELIVLNVCLELQIISPALFAMMVMMALASTLATAPLLHLFISREPSDAYTLPGTAG